MVSKKIVIKFKSLNFKKKEIKGYSSGFATTTHVDKMGERFDLEGLKTISKSMEDNPFLFLEHDSSKPPEGITIEKKIVKMKDGEYGLYVKNGIFDEDVIKKFKNGELAGFSVSVLVKE